MVQEGQGQVAAWHCRHRRPHALHRLLGLGQVAGREAHLQHVGARRGSGAHGSAAHGRVGRLQGRPVLLSLPCASPGGAEPIPVGYA